MSQYIGLNQDPTITEVERRMINRYVIACREAVKHRIAADASAIVDSIDASLTYWQEKREYDHWHYLAHIRLKALQRVRRSL